MTAMLSKVSSTLAGSLTKLRLGLKSRFVRDGGVLAAGNLFSNALGILTAPIMARLYAPEAYGQLGIFIAIYGVYTIPTSLQYHQAVILPEKDTDALAIVKGGLLLGLITSVAGLLGCLLPFKHMFNDSAILLALDWFPLMVLMVLPGCFSTFAMSWLLRKQKYNALSISRIVINLTSTAVAMAIGIWMHAESGLIVANAVGALTGTLALSFAFFATGGGECLRSEWPTVRAQLRKHIQFPLFGTPIQFLYHVSRQVPVFMLSSLSGTSAVGFYSMSNRLLTLPSVFLSESISEVFRQRAAKCISENRECTSLYWKTLFLMIMLAVPCVVIPSIVAPELFAFILGEKWRVAGRFCQVLSVLVVVQLVSTPFLTILSITGKQFEDLIVQSISIALTVVAMVVASRVNGSQVSLLIAYSFGMILTYLFYPLRCYALLREHDRKFQSS
jgi:O-antigen/teichoic acid export membrane protein